MTLTVTGARSRNVICAGTVQQYVMLMNDVMITAAVLRMPFDCYGVREVVSSNIAIESLAGSLLAPSGDYHRATILEDGMSPTGKVRIIACITLCKMNFNNKQPW